MADFNKKSKYRDQSEIAAQITPVQRLMDVINNRRDADKSHPAMMPEKQQDAAKWWMTKVEPMSKGEKPRLEWTKPKRNTDETKQYWVTPYADRLSETLSAFYKLSHPDQMYILDLQQQGIWWRGDSIKFMRTREKVDMGKIDKSKLFSMMKTIIARTRTVDI